MAKSDKKTKKIISAFQSTLSRIWSAGTPLLRVSTLEYDVVIGEIVSLCKELPGANVFEITAFSGVRRLFPSDDKSNGDVQGRVIRAILPKPADEKNSNPLLAMVPAGVDVTLVKTIRTMSALPASEELGDDDAPAPVFIILPDIHQIERNPQVISAIRAWKDFAAGDHYVLVGLTFPGALPPPELQHLWTYETYDLPDATKLYHTLGEIDVNTVDSRETKSAVAHLGETVARQIADAGRGLTLEQFRATVGRGLVDSSLSAGAVWDAKRKVINLKGYVDAAMPRDGGLSNLGGLEGLKTYAKTLLKRWMDQEVKESPKGVVLIGPPGTAKSRFGYHFAAEMGLPFVKVDLGRLFGGLVGDTERNTSEALALINALAPCVACFDELEKMTPGRSSGTLDSGVGNRMLSALLNWFSDRPDNGVFVIGCANDLDGVHPALLRAERFDGTFFVDLPNKEAQKKIWDLYKGEFDIDEKTPIVEDWTGAEIRACCRLAHSLGRSLAEVAVNNVVPIASSNPKLLPNLREGASGKYLCANTGAVYTQDKAHTPARRKAQNVKVQKKNDDDDSDEFETGDDFLGDE